MGDRQAVGPLDVTGLDGGDDLLVFVDILARQTVVECRVVKAQDAAALVEQPGEEGRVIGIA